MALPAPKDRYTFADCLTWGEDERIEIINGEAIMMAPPTRIHQEISGELFRQLANFLEGKKCKVYAAPFAVRLFEKEGDTPADVAAHTLNVVRHGRPHPRCLGVRGGRVVQIYGAHV